MKEGNKKIIFVLLIVSLMFCCISFVGCGADAEQIKTEFISKTGNEPNIENIKDAKEYLDKNIGKVNSEYADFLIDNYVEYLEKFIWNSEVKGKNLEELYLLEWEAEGEIDFLIDYESIKRDYGKRMSPSFSSLIELKSVESLYPRAVDGGLSISWEALIDRAYNVERYIKEYSDTLYAKEEGVALYESYIHLILLGMDNTPAFDHSSGKFSADILKVYKDFSGKYPKSNLAWTLNEYISYLSEIDYTKPKEEDKLETLRTTINRLVSESGRRVAENE